MGKKGKKGGSPKGKGSSPKGKSGSPKSDVGSPKSVGSSDAASAQAEEKRLPDPMMSTLQSLHATIRLGCNSALRHNPCEKIRSQCRALQLVFVNFVEENGAGFLSNQQMLHALHPTYDVFLKGKPLEEAIDDLSDFTDARFANLQDLLLYCLANKYLLRSLAAENQKDKPKQLESLQAARRYIERLALPLDSCQSYLVLAIYLDVCTKLSDLTIGAEQADCLSRADAACERILVCPSTKREDKAKPAANLICGYIRLNRFADISHVIQQYGDGLAKLPLATLCTLCRRLSENKEKAPFLSDALIMMYGRALQSRECNSMSSVFFLYLCEVHEAMKAFNQMDEAAEDREAFQQNITALFSALPPAILTRWLGEIYKKPNPAQPLEPSIQEQVHVCCFVYGKILLSENPFFKQDVDQGLKFLRRAHELGSTDATFALVHYYKHLGTTESYLEAITLLSEVLANPQRYQLDDVTRYNIEASLSHALALDAINRVDPSKPAAAYTPHERQSLLSVITQIESLTQKIQMVRDGTFPEQTMETARNMVEAALFLVNMAKLSYSHPTMQPEQKAEALAQFEQFLVERNEAYVFQFLACAYRDGFPKQNEYLKPNPEKAKRYFEKALEGERTWKDVLEYAVFWAKQGDQEEKCEAMPDQDAPPSPKAYWRAQAEELAEAVGEGVQCRLAYETALSTDAPAASLTMPPIPLHQGGAKTPQAKIIGLLRQVEHQKPAAAASLDHHRQYKDLIIRCMSQIAIQIGELGGQFDLLFHQLPKMAGLLAKAMAGQPELTPQQYAAVLKHFSRFKIAYDEPSVAPYIRAILQEINITALSMNDRFHCLIAICRLRLPEELLSQQLQLYLSPEYCKPKEFNTRTNAELTALLQGFSYATASLDNAGKLPAGAVQTILTPLLAELERRAGLPQYSFTHSQLGQIQHGLSFLAPTLDLCDSLPNVERYCQQYGLQEEKSAGAPSRRQEQIYKHLTKRCYVEHEVYIPQVGRRADFVLCRTQCKKRLVTVVGEYDGWGHGLYNCQGQWVANDISTCLRDKTYSAHDIEVRKLQTHRHANLDESTALRVANDVYRRIKTRSVTGKEQDPDQGEYIKPARRIPRDASHSTFGSSGSSLWRGSRKAAGHDKPPAARQMAPDTDSPHIHKDTPKK